VTAAPVSGLGGGYAESEPDAGPTVAAVLEAATPGQAGSRLVVVAGPPGVGKSSLVVRLMQLIPASVCVDKDAAAGAFILEAATQEGLDPSEAYGSARYWQRLRPLEYGGAVATACANLVGRRVVFLVGGWGPELADDGLWPALARAVTPAGLTVLHLDPPERETWRQRMAGRGSRADRPWFDTFADAVSGLPVWEGAIRLSSDGPLHEVVQRTAEALQPL
jgi:hypothetical protein